MCLQLCTRKTVMLLTLILSLILYYKHSYVLVIIWLKLILLLLYIVGPRIKVMIHEENASMGPTQISTNLGVRIYIAPPHSWSIVACMEKYYLLILLLLLLFCYFHTTSTTTEIMSLISPNPPVLASIGLLPLKLDSL